MIPEFPLFGTLIAYRGKYRLQIHTSVLAPGITTTQPVLMARIELKCRSGVFLFGDWKDADVSQRRVSRPRWGYISGEKQSSANLQTFVRHLRSSAGCSTLYSIPQSLSLRWRVRTEMPSVWAAWVRLP